MTSMTMYIVSRYEFHDDKHVTAMFHSFDSAFMWARKQLWDELEWDINGVQGYKQYSRWPEAGSGIVTGMRNDGRETGYVIKRFEVTYEIKELA